MKRNFMIHTWFKYLIANFGQILHPVFNLTWNSFPAVIYKVVPKSNHIKPIRKKTVRTEIPCTYLHIVRRLHRLLNIVNLLYQKSDGAFNLSTWISIFVDRYVAPSIERKSHEWLIKLPNCHCVIFQLT